MPNGTKDYYNLVQMPWGRMFYDLIYRQLNIEDSANLKILDYGSGFGILAEHYAGRNSVTAIEPDTEMLDLRFHKNEYTQIVGSLDELKAIDGGFDLVVCHNVLEYTPDPDEIFAELARVTKVGGKLSIVKHNLLGRAMAAAVFSENPQRAIEIITAGNDDVLTSFGGRKLYTNEYAESCGQSNGLTLSAVYGIRAFYALAQNNDVKFTKEWYDKMLELEVIAGTMEEYRKIAFFNHLIFEKGMLK